jgi:hypothetical protein
VPVSGDAHSLQNFAPGLLTAPHRGHFAAIGDEHSLQNFAPSGFSVEHCVQYISTLKLIGFELDLKRAAIALGARRSLLW